MSDSQNLNVNAKSDFLSKEDNQKNCCQDLQLIEQKLIDFQRQFNDDDISSNNTEDIQIKKSPIHQYRQLLLSIQSKYDFKYSPEQQNHLSHQDNTSLQLSKKLTEQSFKKNNIQKTLESLQQKLTSNNFIIFKNSKSKLKQNQIQIKLLQQFKNYEIIEIFCQLGRYSKKFIVLYVKSQSFRHIYDTIGFGTFGQVFGCKFLENQKIAIKCLKFKKSETKESLSKIIQEFFIADLMSASEIGPKIFRRSGFDFILFDNCMEFEMQLCSEIQMKTVSKDLKENLFEMHLLKIVHSDIKPANILFSEFYKKNVFLDFGVSNLLNQQIWQKTSTKFKGTYEFSSSEMKNLFLNRKKGQVNMYLNDAQMLMNSIRRLDTQRQFLIQSFFSSSRKSNQSLDENLKQQMVFEFKYHVYSLMKNQIVTPQFNDFLRKLSKLLSQREISYIREKIKYLLTNLKQSSKEIIIQNTFLKGQQNQQMYNIACDFLIYESQDFYSQSNPTKSNINSQQKDEIQLFFDEVQTEQQNSQESLKQQFDQNKQFNSQNLKYILQSPEQIIKLTIEKYFQLFIEFTSFWKSSVKTSIEEKQSVATIFKSLFDTGKIQSHKYLQNMYLPQQSYIKNNCKNLVWSYGYLLSFCMEGEILNQFKANILITVLKDCIFLSFKYDLFLDECLQRYILFLIENQRDMMITLTVIQCYELKYLTTKHFLVETSRLKSYKQKSFLLIKKALFQANNYLLNLKQTCKCHDFIKKDPLVFLKIWKLFADENYQSQMLMKQQQSCSHKQNILSLTSLILQQFRQSKNLQKISIFQKSMRLIYFSNIDLLRNEINSEKIFSFKSLHQYSSFENNFDVLRLIRLKDKTTYKVQANVDYVQQKINCPNISNYIILAQLYIKSFDQKDYSMIQSILKIVYRDFKSSLLNLNIVIKITQETTIFNLYYVHTDQIYYIGKKRETLLKVIEYFTQNPKKYKNQLQKCVYYSSSEEFLDANQNNQIFLGIQDIAYALERLFFNSYSQMGTNLLTLMVGFHLLTNLRQHIKTREKYLKFRLQLFRLILEELNHKFKKIDNKQNKNLQRLLGRQKLKDFSLNKINELTENTKRIDFNNEDEQMFIKKLYIMSILSKEHQQSQTINCQTYYKITKLKTFLIQKFIFSMASNKIIDFSLKKLMFKENFQLLVQFSIETYQRNYPENYSLLSSQLSFMKDRFTNYQQIQFARQFINYLFKFQIQFKLIVNPITLFPLYLHMLLYESYLYQNPQIHKKVLLKAVLLKQKFSFFNLNLYLNTKNDLTSFTVKNHFNQEIMLLSVRYVKKWQGKRKKWIIIRHFLKILIEIRPQFKKYLIYFVFKSFKPNRPKELQKLLINLYEKKTKMFLANLGVPDNFFEDEIKYQNQNRDYYYFNKDDRMIKYRSEMPFKKRIQKYYSEKQKDIINETLLIRKELLDYEYELLCLKLKKQKGMVYQQISWIKKLNQKAFVEGQKKKN